MAPAATAADQGDAAPGRRRAVLHHARSRVGASMRAPAASSGTTPGSRRAATTSATAASAIARRHALLRDARLQSRLARHQGRHESAGTRRSAISISSTTARSRRSSSRTTSSPASAATISTSPATSKRTIPETGDLQWRWYVVAAEEGRPGSDTWPNEEACKHGGGMTWLPVTYDPELNLIYVTTGNPQPVIAHKNRAGDNLFTGSIVALTPTPARWSGTSSRRRTTRTTGTRRRRRSSSTARSTASRASCWRRRRATASSSSSTAPPARRSSRREFVKTNWSTRLRREGPADSESGEDAPDRRRAGVAATRAARPTGRRRASARRPGCSTSTPTRAFSVYYIYDPSDNPEGWGGTDRGGYSESMLQAIDYKTGKIRWSHPWKAADRPGC